MKKLIYIILAIVLVGYAWKKYDLGQYLNKVKVAVADLKEKEDTAQNVLEKHDEARKDLYQIMVLMNEVTLNTMSLEMMKEGKDHTSELPMKQQLEKKMEMLKEQLEEVREVSKENAELTAELERLQNSFHKREQIIRLLTKESGELDEKLQITINEIEERNAKLQQENEMLSVKNAELKKAITNTRKAEVQAWVMAGDELVEAARTIPKANAPAFSGEQSREITRSKQMVLKSATECYNSATNMCNSFGDVATGRQTMAKAQEADRLFKLVTNYEGIGETE